jgi:hypothetical protein
MAHAVFVGDEMGRVVSLNLSLAVFLGLPFLFESGMEHWLMF